MDVRYIFLTYVIVKMVLSKTFAFVQCPNINLCNFLPFPRASEFRVRGLCLTLTSNLIFFSERIIHHEGIVRCRIRQIKQSGNTYRVDKSFTEKSDMTSIFPH